MFESLFGVSGERAGLVLRGVEVAEMPQRQLRPLRLQDETHSDRRLFVGEILATERRILTPNLLHQPRRCMASHRREGIGFDRRVVPKLGQVEVDLSSGGYGPPYGGGFQSFFASQLPQRLTLQELYELPTLTRLARLVVGNDTVLPG